MHFEAKRVAKRQIMVLVTILWFARHFSLFGQDMGQKGEGQDMGQVH